MVWINRVVVEHSERWSPTKAVALVGLWSQYHAHPCYVCDMNGELQEDHTLLCTVIAQHRRRFPIPLVWWHTWIGSRRSMAFLHLPFGVLIFYWGVTTCVWGFRNNRWSRVRCFLPKANNLDNFSSVSVDVIRYANSGTCSLISIATDDCLNNHFLNPGFINPSTQCRMSDMVLFSYAVRHSSQWSLRPIYR